MTTWVLAGVAVLLAGFAWLRVAQGGWITGPHRLAWRGPDDKPLLLERYDSTPCRSMMDGALVLGERLILSCYAAQGIPAGYAWLDPRRGEAKLAWAIPSTIEVGVPQGVAARDVDTFAVAFDAQTPDGPAVVAAVAGRDRWTVPPTAIAPIPGDDSGKPILLGMAWIDGELEVVLTHPTPEEPYGRYAPPDVIRLKAGAAAQKRSAPLPPCDSCTVAGALPGPHGWQLVSVDLMSSSVLLISPEGAATPARPDLAWWVSATQTDRIAHGTLWGRPATDAPVAERDGSRHPGPAAPLPGFQPVIAFRRVVLVDGVFRTKAMWGVAPDDIDVIAQTVGRRTIVTATSPADEDLQLVGATPDQLAPILFSSTSTGFRIGEFLPAGDGYYWVSGDGEYVTLDRELRRTDPLSLVHHLRTRGSVGDFIDEPSYVVYLGWLLFGLPIVAGIAVVVRRRWPAAVAVLLGGYIVTALWALINVLPLLARGM